MKHPKKPVWSNQEIMDSIKKRNMYKKNKDHTNYRLQRNSTKTLIKRTKMNYHDALRNSKENTKKMWKSVKEISGINKVKKTSISKLVENDIDYTNDKDITDMLK